MTPAESEELHQSSENDNDSSATLPEMPVPVPEQQGALADPVSDPGPAPVSSAPWASTAVPAYIPDSAPGPSSGIPADSVWSLSAQEEPEVPVAPTVAPALTRRELRETGAVLPEADLAAFRAQTAETVATPVQTEAPTVVAPVIVDPIEQALVGDDIVELEAPQPAHNRGAAVLIFLVATVAFAILYALLSAVVIALTSFSQNFISHAVSFATSPLFIVPIVVFLVVTLLLALIANRTGWWFYAVGGFVVAVLVAASVIAWVYLANGATLVNPFAQPQAAVSGLSFPTDLDTVLWLVVWAQALAAGVAAREVTLWFGAWAGGRGRRISRRNAREREAFVAGESAA